MSVLGFLWAIVYYKPNEPPPDGLPRVLAEYFVPGHSNKEPEEIRTYKRPQGWTVSITPLTKPIKPLSPERKAKIRRQRLERRMKKRYPLFADQFIREAIQANPSYYLDGVSPEDEAYNLALDEYQRKLVFLQSNAGKLLEYARPETL